MVGQRVFTTSSEILDEWPPVEHMEDVIRAIIAEYGFELTDEEIQHIALQAAQLSTALKPLFDVDVTKTMPILTLDKRIQK
jgi:hypothetical protein